MSICRCSKHDKNWDSDLHELCPDCQPEYDTFAENRIEIEALLDRIEQNYAQTGEMEFSMKILKEKLYDIDKELKSINKQAFGG